MKKYGTLLSLYLAQAIPMSFFSTVVPVIMRQEEYSLTSIGYLQLLKLPWIVKFLWAPMIDRQGKNRKNYKRIILASEIFYAVIILSIGFFNLQSDFKTIIILMTFAFFASATQDIATDAFAILSLKKSERSLGNSMQSAGSFLGTLVGSGVLLIIYYHYGWQMLLVGLALFVVIALTPLMFFKTENEVVIENQKEREPAKMKDILSFFRQKGIFPQIITLAIYYTGIIGILAMVKPFLVDLGFQANKIGFISGIFGTSMGAASALLAGFLIKKWGVKLSIKLFSFYNLLAALGFLFLSKSSQDIIFIYLFISLLWSAYGVSSVTIYTLAMNRVRPGREGTDFTIQIVITHLSSMIVAISAGKIADAIGYEGLYGIEVLVAITVFILVMILFHSKNMEYENSQRVNSQV